jgi:hypothetical protein
MDDYGIKRLLCAIIEQAVLDRRTAITRGLVKVDGIPARSLNSKEAELCYGLNYFFEKDGIRFVSDIAGFALPITKIKERSKEILDDDERRRSKERDDIDQRFSGQQEMSGQKEAECGETEQGFSGLDHGHTGSWEDL